MTTIDQPGSQPLATIGTSRVWLRALFMLIFMFLLGIASGVLWAVMLIQVVWLLFTRAPNAYLVTFGKSLADWAAEVVKFQTCATETKPFPWQHWPAVD